MHPEVQQPFLRERIRWLAKSIERDDRTARRRMDTGLAQLAEMLRARHARADTHPNHSIVNGWYIEEFRAALILDRPSPEAIGWRRIVAERDGINEIPVIISMPKDSTDRSAPNDLAGDVIYGGTLYALSFRVPIGQPMRTHYVFTSRRRYDVFDLRIRFDIKRLPNQVWRLTNSFHRAVDDGQPSEDMLVPDSVGELHLRFHDLTPGFGYGAQWTAGEAS